MFDEKHLESQVDAMLAEFTADIDDVPAPSDAAVERTKAAVRHEINEQWLASHPSPQPSEDALRRTRTAVRSELKRGRARRANGWRLPPQVLAGLAAAAMLAACVGLIRYVGYLQPTTTVSPMLAAAQEHVDLFVEAAEYTLATDEFSESIRNELNSIYARMPGNSQQQDDDNDVLDELDRAIEEFFENSRKTDGIMGGASWPREVVG